MWRFWWVGAIGLISSLSLLEIAAAQVVPDGTLGAESSQVGRARFAGRDGVERDNDVVFGGARRGSNLFHSFEQFDVPEGQGAYFDSPADIRNIFSRVTGADRSEILGTLGAFGNANLFFMNPNGIVFGPNSSLDVGGSFVGTTANAIGFGDAGFFSATTPEIPAPLLTVSPSAFFFNQVATGDIVNLSTAPDGLRPSGSPEFGLRVPDGQSLVLLGGNVFMAGGRLNALGGRIELGGLVSPGVVGLTIDGNVFRLGFPSVATLGNLGLVDDARVSVRGVGGGDIAVNADRFIATDGGRLIAGTEGAGRGGDINVNANQITLSGVGTSASGFFNQVIEPSEGDTGNIIVNSRSLSLLSNAVILNSSSQGENGNIVITTGELGLGTGSSITNEVSTTTGNAGNIIIQAGNVLLSGSNGIALIGNSQNRVEIRARLLIAGNSTIGSFSELENSRSGDVLIETTDFVGEDVSIFSGATAATGRAGNIDIRGVNSVTLSGESSIATQAGGNLSTDSGNLTITSGNLSLQDSSISTDVPSTSGNSGQITIRTTGPVNLNNSRVISEGSGSHIIIESSGALDILNGSQVAGRSGSNITITADSVSLAGFSPTGASEGENPTSSRIGSPIDQATSNEIRITANSVSLRDGASILTSSVSGVNAGTIQINARDSVEVVGSASSESNPASSIQAIAPVASGGNINITVSNGALRVLNGGFIASSAGTGRGGDIEISANEVQVAGASAFPDRNTGSDSPLSSSIRSSSFSIPGQLSGDAGNIIIRTNQLSLQQGGGIVTGTSGQGRGGDIRIDVRDSGVVSRVEITGTSPFTSLPVASRLDAGTSGSGRAGDIIINTERLAVRNGGTVTAVTTGSGRGGDIRIEARDVEVSGLSSGGDPSSLGTPSLRRSELEPVGQAGNITINTDRFSLRGGASLTSFASANEGGTVRINARESVEITGVGNTRFGAAPSSIFTNASEEATRAGDIFITTDQMNVREGLISAETSGSGRGGNIQIDATSLSLTNNAGITASTSGAGNTGSITVQANRGIELAGNSSITSEVQQGATGNSQNITLATPELTLQRNSEISAATNGNGRAGSIVIRGTTENTPASSVALNNSSISTEVQQNGVVDAANAPSNIDIRTRALNLDNGSNVTANTSGQGNAGNITVQEAEKIALSNNSRISTAVNSGAVGAGGNIQTTTAALTLTNNSQISAATSSTGNPGSISVQNADTVSLNNSTISSAVDPGGTATQRSNIDIQTRTLNLNNGSNVIASTANRGDAGNITVHDADTVNLNNSTISSTVNSGATGNGGNVTLDTRSLELNQGSVTASTNGNGRAGGVTISNAEQVLLNRGTISTAVGATGVGQGGDISVQTGQLNLQNRSNITSSTANRGDTGSITVNADQGINLRRNSSISNRVETGATGNSQRITLNTPSLSLRGNSTISAATDGNGQAGDIQIQNAETVSLSNSSISTQVQRNAVVPNQPSTRAQSRPNANQGNITIDTRSLNLANGAEITASTEGRGRAGNVTVNNADTITLSDNSTISSAVRRNGRGRGGSVTLETNDLNLDNSRITASTNGRGRAGNITVRASSINATNGGRIISSTNRGRPAGTIALRDLDQLTLSGRASGIFANTSGNGRGGRITVTTQTLNLNDRAAISTSSRSGGRAGDIQITAVQELQAEEGTITTRAIRSAGGNIQVNGGNLNLSQGSSISTEVSTGEGDGGAITVNANDVRLQGDSDIQTRIGSTGTGNGGDITVNADSVIAFDDSDIITEAPQGQGGDIQLNTPVFFGSGYVPNLTVDNADNNGRVDLDASGAVSAGAVQTPDTSFIQNSLADLPANAIDPDSLIANSCIARTESGGTFLITGTGGLPPNRPDTNPPAAYPTDTVRTESTWQPGDPIIEPQAVYQLPNGELVLVHECTDQ